MNCAGKTEQFTGDFSWIGELQCLKTDFGAPCGAPQALVIVDFLQNNPIHNFQNGYLYHFGKYGNVYNFDGQNMQNSVPKSNH